MAFLLLLKVPLWDKPDDDLIARFCDLCNQTGGLTEDELAEVKLVGPRKSRN
jgi:hypothetical protein